MHAPLGDLEPAGCHLEANPRRSRALRRRLALVRDRNTRYPNRGPQRARWLEIEHAPHANRSDRSRGSQQVSFAVVRFATSSIHSAPFALAAKSNSLLWGVGHNASPADVSRHAPSEVASTCGLHARTTTCKLAASAPGISGRCAAALLPISVKASTPRPSGRGPATS
jgi:hypothetical protein